MEHRWGDRRKMMLRVRLYGPGPQSAIGRLMDVSLSGCYIKTMATLSTLIPIHIEVDERQGGNAAAAPMRLSGRVIRQGATGVGVEWEEFDSGTLGQLLRIAISIRPNRIARTPDVPQFRALWTLAMSGASNDSLNRGQP